MADPVNDWEEWVDGRTAGAPPGLRDRVLAWVARTEVGSVSPPTRLAEAGRAALAAALRAGEGRAVARDLLAADALVTLALLAQADADPRQLGGFARGVRSSGADAT